MVSCFSDTSIKLPFNWERIQIGESFTHALSSISFSNFFGTHKTDVCLEWLLLCGLLTWRQLYRFFVTKGGCGYVLPPAPHSPERNDKWQALELQNVDIPTRLCVILTHSTAAWHFAYAMLIFELPSPDSAFYVFFTKTMMADHIKWTIYLNSINAKKTNTVFALYSFRTASFLSDCCLFFVAQHHRQ